MTDERVIIEYLYRDVSDSEFWVDVNVDRKPYAELGPFASPEERERAHTDLMNTMRELGANDIPTFDQ